MPTQFVVLCCGFWASSLVVCAALGKLWTPYLSQRGRQHLQERSKGPLNALQGRLEDCYQLKPALTSSGSSHRAYWFIADLQCFNFEADCKPLSQAFITFPSTYEGADELLESAVSAEADDISS